MYSVNINRCSTYNIGNTKTSWCDIDTIQKTEWTPTHLPMLGDDDITFILRKWKGDMLLFSTLGGGSRHVFEKKQGFRV